MKIISSWAFINNKSTVTDHLDSSPNFTELLCRFQNGYFSSCSRNGDRAENTTNASTDNADIELVCAHSVPVNGIWPVHTTLVEDGPSRL